MVETKQFKVDNVKIRVKDERARADIADNFSERTSYAIGDLVIYEGYLYKFTSAHSAGAWSGTDVTQITIAGQLNAMQIDIDGKLNTKSDVTHVHDERYYTETEMDALLTTKLNPSDIASEFSDSVSYAGGDLVAYDNHPYKFTSAHPAGAWLGTDATQITVEDELKSISSSFNTALSGKSNNGHTHDDRYYTETETNTLLNGKSNNGHTHDDRYYTEGEVNNLLNGKRAIGEYYCGDAVDIDAHLGGLPGNANWFCVYTNNGNWGALVNRGGSGALFCVVNFCDGSGIRRFQIAGNVHNGKLFSRVYQWWSGAWTGWQGW